MARVHMHGGHKRGAHVGHKAYAAGPEFPVVASARDLLAEVLAEVAVDRGNVDAHLFENAAAHDGHDPSAAVAVGA